MTLLWAFLSRVGMKAWLFAAGALAFLAVLAKVRQSGKEAERAKQLRSTVKAHEVRRDVETKNATLPGGAARDERMRRKGILRD